MGESYSNDSKARMTIALYLMRGGRLKEEPDEEKKKGLYQADLEGSQQDWADDGEEGPETLEASRLYVACLDANGDAKECETESNWAASCIECETESMAQSSVAAPPVPSWIVCLVATSAASRSQSLYASLLRGRSPTTPFALALP